MSDRTRQREPFFSTKLEVPPVAAWAVRRTRLLEALDAGAETPLTLVAGPAGSGKTALLASWVESGRAGAVAWVSLGPQDGQRRRFWATAVAALGRAAPPLRSLSIPPAARIDSFLPALVDRLAGLKRPVTLVLDDFHEVGAGAVANDLDAILDHPPERLRLVVATRADPAFRLERLRVAGRLSEVRAHELAFTLAEAGELGTKLGLGLGPEDLETLWRRTEGWAAALRLAGLSLRGRPDAHAFVEGFAGDDRALADYILAEVIARQPPETLEFLKRTAIVDRLNGDLADALTGGTGGGRMLADLAHREGLVDPLDASGAWYRYHRLFADVLRMELARTAAGELPELHGRAARWHAGRGHPLDAVHHAVGAHDWDLAADIAAEHWLSLLLRGEGPLLLESLGSVPDEVVRAQPELALAVGGLMLDNADDRRADELLAAAREGLAGLPESRRRRQLVAATCTDLYRARLLGNVEEALESACAVLDEPWALDVADDVRALTLTNLGVAEFWADRHVDAARHLKQAVGIARARGNDYLLFLAQGYAAAVELQSGRLAEADRRAGEALQLSALGGWSTAPQAAIAYLTLAGAAVFRTELDTADDLVERARAALDRSGERLLRLGLAQLRARLLAARGDPVSGLDVLRGALSAAPSPMPRFLEVWARTLEADLLLAIGEADEARQVAHDLDSSNGAREAALSFGRLELADGRPEGAISAVADFFADRREEVQPNARVEAWVIDAVARDALHDEDGALRALERAMDLAEPRGFRSSFVRHGARVRSLVRRRISAGTSHRAFAGDLLVALGDEPGHAPHNNGPLLEPLSDRELAVLRFLPTMMSNAEIAGEMFVSVNTVKTHLKHVYRKLDVTDRRDAVRRARDLHLLSPGLGER